MTVQNDFYIANGAPGLAVSQFFTGATPASKARFDELSAEVAKQEKSYGDSGVSYPELAGYEAFGKAFAAAYPDKVSIGTASEAFFTATYQAVFGRAGTADQIDHFEAQEAYFKGIYLNNGFTAEAAAIEARGAAVGQLLGAAVADVDANGAPTNAYGKGVAAFYADASDQNVTYGKPLGDYKPDVVTTPGPTVYVPVPGPVVDKADVIAKDFDTIATVHKNATGGLFFGDGTTTAQGLASVVDPTSGITIAVGVSPRQSVEGNYRPEKVSFDGVTLTADYTVPAGSQLAANGSQADRAASGAISASFTFGDADTKLVDFINGGGKFVIGYDQDPTAGVSRLMLTSVVATGDKVHFVPTGGVGGITDSGGNANTVANSEQQNFFLSGGVAALTPGSHFSNSFEAFDAGGVKLVGIIENMLLGAAGFSPNDQIA